MEVYRGPGTPLQVIEYSFDVNKCIEGARFQYLGVSLLAFRDVCIDGSCIILYEYISTEEKTWKLSYALRFIYAA